MSKNGKVWRKNGEVYSLKCIRQTINHHSMLMVWGCMSSNGLGKLVFVEGNINSLKYQEILDESLNFFIAMLRGDGSPIFQ